MDEQKMGGEMKKCGGGIHWTCCLMPMLGHLAFIFGVLSLIFAFVAGTQGMFWGLPMGTWMISGLVAGVLAMSGTKKRMGACKMACGDHKCGTC